MIVSLYLVINTEHSLNMVRNTVRTVCHLKVSYRVFLFLTTYITIYHHQDLQLLPSCSHDSGIAVGMALSVNIPTVAQTTMKLSIKMSHYGANMAVDLEPYF